MFENCFCFVIYQRILLLIPSISEIIAVLKITDSQYISHALFILLISFPVGCFFLTAGKEYGRKVSFVSGIYL